MPKKGRRMTGVENGFGWRTRPEAARAGVEEARVGKGHERLSARSAAGRTRRGRGCGEAREGAAQLPACETGCCRDHLLGEQSGAGDGEFDLGHKVGGL